MRTLLGDQLETAFQYAQAGCTQSASADVAHGKPRR